jgi:hypothetical protein
MSRYTPVDFIAPNVEVSIVYDVKSNDELNAKWSKCTIKEVQKRGVFGNGVKFVVCNVQMLDKTGAILNETLYDSDYECETHFAWKFSDTFKPLVDQLMNVDDTNNDPDYEPPSEEESDEEVDDDDASNLSETDEYEEDDERETDEDTEYNFAYIKRTPSLSNRVFATLFMLSPWFASLAVVYNARDDIFKYLKNKYC